MAAPLSFTHVKWDALSFQRLIAEKLKSEPPTPHTPKGAWEHAAEIALSVFNPDCLSNTILFSNSLKEMKGFTMKYIQEEFEGRPECAEILDKIQTLYSNTYQEIRSSDWDKIPKEGFLRLYREFLQSHKRPKENSYFSHCLNSWYSEKCFDIEDLDLEIPWRKLLSLYQQHGVLQIREIDPDATTLIIGCGNGRFTNEGNTEYDLYDEDEAQYSLQHNHPRNCVTIDIDAAANPTIIASFGQRSVVPLFQGKKFNEIIIEAIRLQGPTVFSDLQTLLAPNGRIVGLDDDVRKIEIPLESFAPAGC